MFTKENSDTAGKISQLYIGYTYYLSIILFCNHYNICDRETSGLVDQVTGILPNLLQLELFRQIYI